MKSNVSVFAVTSLIMILAVLMPTFLGRYWIAVGMEFCVYLALVASWMLLCGLSGYLSLGHVVFFGVGGYIAAVGWEIANPWLLVLAGAAGAALLAVLVGYPALRARGPYFVMLTFGLAELAKFVVIKVEAWSDSFGRLMMFGPDLNSLFRATVILAGISFLMLVMVQRSRLGAGLRAIREDETAAETIGIPAARIKYLGFIMSAIVPGAIGAVVAMRAGSYEPAAAFDPVMSVTIICMAVIGGSDDARGAIFGVAFMVLLQKILWTTMPQAFMIVLGLCLITFVVFLPDGLVGLLKSMERDRGKSLPDPQPETV